MLLTALLSAAALAAPPTYKWTDGETVRYFLQTDIFFAEGQKIFARENIGTTVNLVSITVETTCQVEKAGKNHELVCALSHVDFSSDEAPNAREQATITSVMGDWERLLQSASVGFIVQPDGRLRDFDLKKVETKNAREASIAELLRSYLKRAYSPLEVILTTDDKDWVRGWSVKKYLAMVFELPYIAPAFGAGTHNYTHHRDMFGLVGISHEGRASVAPGDAAESEVNGALIDMRVGGEAWIDPERGQLLFSGYATDGRRTASSSDGALDQAISQRSAAQRVEAFAADHSPPSSVVAARAPRISKPPTPPAEGIELVPFASMGMDPLFIQGLPQQAEGYELPVSTVRVRVMVDTVGTVSAMEVYEGYEVLQEHVERGLKTAAFAKRGAPYLVDVDVEVRP